MKDTSKENDKKKGFLAAVWESMTKTGGCCGSGGSCCGPSKSEVAKKKSEQESAAQRPELPTVETEADRGVRRSLAR